VHDIAQGSEAQVLWWRIRMGANQLTRSPSHDVHAPFPQLNLPARAYTMNTS